MNSTVIFRQTGGTHIEAYHRIDLIGPERYRKSGGTMMIVDDNNILLNCLKLTAENYFDCEVEEYLSPAKAWEAFQRDPGRYRCVITDFHMPQMTGGDLICRIHANCPDMPVVLMSAAADPDEAGITGDTPARFVRKPFDWDEVIADLESMEASPPLTSVRVGTRSTTVART